MLPAAWSTIEQRFSTKQPGASNRFNFHACELMVNNTLSKELNAIKVPKPNNKPICKSENAYAVVNCNAKYVGLVNLMSRMPGVAKRLKRDSRIYIQRVNLLPSIVIAGATMWFQGLSAATIIE